MDATPDGSPLAVVLAVSVGRPRARPHPAAPERTYRTAIAKRPVTGPAQVGTLGLAGDAQADRRHHGGPDKAVHAHFAQPWWGQQRDRPVRPGEIGENLTLAAAAGAPEPDESTFCEGDVLAVGTALLQVTAPRLPCFKQADRLGLPDAVARAEASGRTGFYLRVLREGEVAAGDAVQLLQRTAPQRSLAEANRRRARA